MDCGCCKSMEPTHASHPHRRPGVLVGGRQDEHDHQGEIGLAVKVSWQRLCAGGKDTVQGTCTPMFDMWIGGVIWIY